MRNIALSMRFSLLTHDVVLAIRNVLAANAIILMSVEHSTSFAYPTTTANANCIRATLQFQQAAMKRLSGTWKLTATNYIEAEFIFFNLMRNCLAVSYRCTLCS